MTDLLPNDDVLSALEELAAIDSTATFPDSPIVAEDGTDRPAYFTDIIEQIQAQTAWGQRMAHTIRTVARVSNLTIREMLLHAKVASWQQQRERQTSGEDLA